MFNDFFETFPVGKENTKNNTKLVKTNLGFCFRGSSIWGGVQVMGLGTGGGGKGKGSIAMQNIRRDHHNGHAPHHKHRTLPMYSWTS